MLRKSSDSWDEIKITLDSATDDYPTINRSRNKSKSCLMLGGTCIPHPADEQDAKTPLLLSKKKNISSSTYSIVNYTTKSLGMRVIQEHGQKFSVSDRNLATKSPCPIVKRSSSEGISTRRLNIVPIANADKRTTSMTVNNVQLVRARFLGLMGMYGRQGPLPNKMKPVDHKQAFSQI